MMRIDPAIQARGFSSSRDFAIMAWRPLRYHGPTNLAGAGSMGRIITTSAIALLTMALGGFIMFHSLGVFGAVASTKDAPVWLGVAIGFVFFAGGCCVILKAIFGDLDSGGGELPPQAPAAARFLYGALGISIVAGLGSLFSWVAFGPGERQFGGSGAFLGPFVGRAMFGLAALLTWFFLGLSVLLWIRRRGDSS
jgi:hypothetical protein